MRADNSFKTETIFLVIGVIIIISFQLVLLLDLLQL